MNDATVRLEGVSKGFQSGSDYLEVIRNVDLEASAGESVAVIGASGSGKSTLLNLIGGLDSVDSGTVTVSGRNVSALGENGLTEYRSRGVGFVFQFHYLLKDFTALENVMLPMVMTGTDRNRAERAAGEALDRVSVADRLGHYPAQLSGGERQRVALARALVNDPRLVLCDEPIGNLDRKSGQELHGLLERLHRNRGTGIVIVTHDTGLAALAGRRLRLENGILNPDAGAGTY